MRLLIAGGHGQVAQALVRSAARRPEITALAIGRPALDLCTPASIAGALSSGRPDVIINSAAYTAVDQAEADEDAAFRLNATGAGLIAAEAARRGAAIVHISTDYVFDGANPRAYRPDDPTGPINAYGRTKLAGEVAVRDAARRHVIVRTSWVHSATGKNFVRTMLNLAQNRDEIRVVGDQWGSPTFAPHLADALIDVAVKAAAGADDDPIWGTYHAAGSGVTTWAGLAERALLVSAELGGPTARIEAITTAEYPTPARRPVRSVLDCSDLERVFSVRLPDWEEGAQACVGEILGEGADGRAAPLSG